MGKRLKLLGGTGAASILALVAIVGRSHRVRGEVAADGASTTGVYELLAPASPEPISGGTITAEPGSPTNQRAPSEPYGIGPVDQAWTLEQLPAAERAAVEELQKAGPPHRNHTGVQRAAEELSIRARGEAAQHDLGVDDLGAIGVVP